jgi:adenylate cyclase
VKRRLYGWEALLALGVASGVAIGLRFGGDSGPMMRVESLTLDARFRLRPAPPTPKKLVVVTIDDASIAEIGRWPWSRSVFARFVDRMGAVGASVVAFDLLFTERQPSPLLAEHDAIKAAMTPWLERLSPLETQALDSSLSALERSDDPDAAFAAAIGRRDGAVIVPFAMDVGAGGAPSAAIPPLPDELEHAEYGRVRGSGPDRLPAAIGLRLPLKNLAGAASLAQVTVIPDSAGGFHYDYPVLAYDASYFPSLSLEAVRNFLGIAKENVLVDLGRGVDLGPLHVPTDDGMRLLVNYYPPGIFQQIRFADALMGRVAASELAGKIVLVGATAAGLGDVFATPYTPALAGVLRHATLVANMLDGDFLTRDYRVLLADVLTIFLAAIGVALLSSWSMTAASVGAACLLAGLALVDVFAFDRWGLWLNFTFPALTIFLAYGLILFGKYTLEWRRERWIRQVFSKYLHPALVEELCRSPDSLKLGGEERELTVLFADIRDFTTVSESLTASELVSLMNEFFTAMTDVVLANRGMLDKYIGDSLMAVFGAPLHDAQHAKQGCRAAIEMRAALASLHARWRAEGRPCLEMRIGINTGRMIIGNVGAARRFDYTVMGDEVNVASRLEGANKALHTDILISEATAEALGKQFPLTPRGEITVKGRHKLVQIFELLTPNDEEAQGGVLTEGGRT